MGRINVFFNGVFRGLFLGLFIRLTGWQGEKTKVNLCSGANLIPGYWNLDLEPRAELVLDLERFLLPFRDSSMDVVVCISAINYFTRDRAQKIVKDVFRVLKPGGIARFGVQDLKILTEKYVNRDEKFFFEKLPDGRDRFPGGTIADKFNQWFFGFPSFGGKTSKYVYDFESLSFLFKTAGFKEVKNKKYRESVLPEIEKIDNRPGQMFFLEATK